jgi:hypothetical protein
MPKKIKITEVNNLSTDFRSDVIAAGFVDSGVDIETIDIRRRDSAVRDTDKEISSINHLEHDYEGNGGPVLRIRTNRRGIYDNLPEGVFHNLSGLHEQSKDAIVGTFKHQSREEVNVRRFFSLYETEIERSRVDIQSIELQYDRPDRHRTMVDTMARLWPEINRMDTLTAMLFLRTVPYIADIRGNYSRTAQALSTITGYGVTIANRTRIQTPKARYTRLNSMKLGVNSVLRGAIPIRFAEVSFTPPRNDLSTVLPGRERHEVLRALLDAFMPNDIDYEIVIRPHPEDYTARIGDKSLPCILGVNAKLNNK